MLFSDNFPDWSVFSEREAVALDVELVSPAAEVTAILSMHHAVLNESLQAVENERRKVLDALAEQAKLVVQLSVILGRYESAVSQAATGDPQSQLSRSYRSLRLMKDQMLDALQNAGLTVEIPLGKSFDEVAEVVHVEGWRHLKDFSSEIVIEVMEPIVRYGKTVVRHGRVVMGAPLKEEAQTVFPQEIE